MPTRQTLIRKARQSARDNGVSLYSKPGTATVRVLVAPYLARLCSLSGA